MAQRVKPKKPALPKKAAGPGSQTGKGKTTKARRAVSVRVASGRPVVPVEYAGKWIAWAADGRSIIAAANDPEALLRAAEATGQGRFTLERVPARTAVSGA